MEKLFINQAIAATPELFLAAAALFGLLIAAFKDRSFLPTLTTGLMAFVVVTIGIIAFFDHGFTRAFGDMFISNAFTNFVKILILIATASVLFLFTAQASKNDEPAEFPILILFAAVGMMFMVSANNLLTLYLGLELQSLCLYILAAIKRNNDKSSEAGLKYFVLGALTSGLLLYGISLIYGFTGTIHFAEIQSALTNETISAGALIGMVLVIIAFCFKVSAVPFHMWTPDVYQGAPTLVTAFFSTAPKVAALAVFLRLSLEVFGNITDQWRQIILFVSVASMYIGALGALRQTNFKRLLAYSSIGHVGYALIGLAVGNSEGTQAVLLYLALYVTMSLGIFTIIMMSSKRKNLRGEIEPAEEIGDMAGLAKTHPLRALAVAIFMLSLAGIPPLAGFFGKLYIFKAAIHAELYAIAILGILASAISAFYYLRVIKVMYFDTTDEPLTTGVSTEYKLVAGTFAVFNTFFIFYPLPIIEFAYNAAVSFQ